MMSAISVSQDDYTSEISHHEVSYSMVETVVKSWGKVEAKNPAKWKDDMGEMLLRKMFQLDSDIKVIFGFSYDLDPLSADLKHNKSFISKGSRLVDMFNMAIEFLGPDLETLEDTLVDLGGRHVARKVETHHFAIIGQALFYCLQMSLGLEFGPKEQESWQILYRFLSYNMVKGLQKKEHELAMKANRNAAGSVHTATTKGSNASFDYSSVPSSVDASRRLSGLSRASSISSTDTSMASVNMVDLTEEIKTEDISYGMVDSVTRTWDKVTRIPSWKAVVGEIVLRTMFELDWEVKVIFGFPEDLDPAAPELKDDKAFMAKASALVGMIDQAISFLGPDLEPLEETLFELGQRHVALRVRAQHFGLVGKGLVHALEKLLKKRDFPKKARDNWIEMYRFFSSNMIKGLHSD